ncbi:hypothetical protein DYQ86_24620 [Acidobacteria bacterium AB60]|nr:hypothetical protein DYQ86_24620 [Acidobacteria bacterium AB60]
MTEPANNTVKAIHYPGLFTLFIAWSLLGSLACIRHLLLDSVPHAHFARELAGWLTCYFPWILITPFVFRLERSFQVGRNRRRGNALVLLAAGIALSYISAASAGLMNIILQDVLKEPIAGASSWWKTPPSEFVFQIALYLVALLAAYIIRNLIDMQESERRASQLALEKSQIEASLRSSELEVLRMRLNPHFLFNSLQNISSLTRQDPDAASLMLARLGDVLRAALRKGQASQTTLTSEIALTRAYVEVEQIRFSGKLSVLFEIDRGLENALVPGFLLQPLVENSIVHGLRGGQASGAIWIRAIRETDNLVLSVSDNGAGPPAERLADLEMGIGLGSTCERLERMFPQRHSISMRKLTEGGTEIRLVLPLEFSENATAEQRHELASSPHRR